jgi:hypothetical protein
MPKHIHLSIMGMDHVRRRLFSRVGGKWKYRGPKSEDHLHDPLRYTIVPKGEGKYHMEISERAHEGPLEYLHIGSNPPLGYALLRRYVGITDRPTLFGSFFASQVLFHHELFLRFPCDIYPLL